MANLAGFMPQPGPGAIYGGDWSQPWSGVMDTLLQSQQAGQQRAWDQSPSGPSFNRRFGGMLPPSLNMPSAPVQQQADPQTLAALQGALSGAIQDSESFMLPNNTVQHSGSMQSQPWYDEFLAAHEAGAPTPMLQNMGGRGLNPTEQAGIQQRRQERLGGTLPMADRRANVRNNAIAESEQRSVRMGDMSENQQYFNELARLQGALGGQQGGGNLMNGVLFGPEAMVGMDRNQTEGQIARDRLGFAGSPVGMMAASIANGTPISMQQIQQMISGAPLPEQILQQSGGDWGKFKTMANASGMSAQETLDAWARLTGDQRGGVQTPGFLDVLSGAGGSAGWDWNPYD